METQGHVPSLHVKMLVPVPTSEPGSAGLEEGGPLGLADQLLILTLCLSPTRQSDRAEAWHPCPFLSSFHSACVFTYALALILSLSYYAVPQELSI